MIIPRPQLAAVLAYLMSDKFVKNQNVTPDEISIHA